MGRFRHGTQDLKMMARLDDSIRFLNDHPALLDGRGECINNMCWYVIDKCRNGHSSNFQKDGNKVEIIVYRGSRLFRKFREKYLEDPRDISIHIPYVEAYGRPWKIDHWEYFGEVSIYKYVRAGSKDTGYDDVYQAYQGASSSARTFEEMVVKLAAAVRRSYGNFGNDDFLTPEERENHDAHDPFLWIPCNDDDHGDRCYVMEMNPDYFKVPQGTINLRWWNWYRNTDHCRKNWPEESGCVY